MKPIIGIVGRSTKDSDDYSIIYTNNYVIKAVIEFGGIPIIIAPTQNIDYEEKLPKDAKRLSKDEKKDLNVILNKCDGIILPGGNKWYEYDEYICKYVVDNDIPVLGICAGMQLLSKVLNNNKIDGIDSTIRNNTVIDHHQKSKYVHKVKVLKDTKLYDILGKEEISVNSRHNYHISKELSFMASAYSEDGLIEAIEYKDNKFTIGIQWHPESMTGYDLDARKIIEIFMEETKNKS